MSFAARQIPLHLGLFTKPGTLSPRQRTYLFSLLKSEESVVLLHSRIQTLTLPIFHLHVRMTSYPFAGASSNRGLLAKSLLLRILRRQLKPPGGHADGREYFVYADAGYDSDAVLATSALYRNINVPPGTHEEADSVRVSVENVFGTLKGMYFWVGAEERYAC